MNQHNPIENHLKYNLIIYKEMLNRFKIKSNENSTLQI